MRIQLCQRLLLSGRRINSNGRAFIIPNSQNYSTSACEDYDIVVAGGGMVGTALACSLGQSKRLSDLRILLLEACSKKESIGFPDSWKNNPYSNRVCAISPPSQRLLDALGAWQNILGVRSKPVSNMQVWESESDAHISFGDGQQSAAHIVENDVILESLRCCVPASIEIRYECSADSYNLPKSLDEKTIINLHDGSKIATNLLIGCDGTSSLVRKTMGGQYLSFDYNQMAIVATLNLEDDPAEKNTTAWQKFLPTGPIALLPLTHNTSSLVWSTTKSHAKSLLAIDEQSFVDALNTSLWTDGSSSMPPWLHELQQNCTNIVRDVGRMLSPGDTVTSVSYKQLPPAIVGMSKGSRGAFPLGLGHAIHYTSPRVALLGDAAHRVHPLAGQGVNLGFADVAALTRTLESGVSCGEDVGCPIRLQQYETERQKQNVVMMAAIDSLHRLYTTKFPPAVFARSVGLSAVGALQPVKTRIEAFMK